MPALEITPLATSIHPLVEWFNDNRHRSRFLTVLSPT